MKKLKKNFIILIIKKINKINNYLLFIRPICI